MLNVTYNNQPSPDALKTMDILERAVANELDRKRRLGQYAVFADLDGNSILVGEDAPTHNAEGKPHIVMSWEEWDAREAAKKTDA